MQKNIFIKKNSIAVFSLLIILGGCKQDEILMGKSTVLLSGTLLELDLDASLQSSGRFHFIFEHINGAGRIRFEMPLRSVLSVTGSYIIKENVPGAPYTSLTTLDNDLALDEYVLLENEDNTVSLTEIDTTKQIVCGTFQITFVRDTLLSAIKKDIFPDTIRLTEGTFEAPYEKK